MNNPTPSTSEAKALPNDERLVLALLELNTLRERVIGLEKERDFAVSQRESAFIAEDHTNGECSELMAERDDANAERDAALRTAEEATAAMMTMRDTVLAEVTERRDWFFARWQESKNAGYVELADKIHWKNEAEKLAKDSYANKSRALDAEEVHAEFCALLADVLHLPADATASQILQGAIDMISQARTIKADHGMMRAALEAAGLGGEKEDIWMIVFEDASVPPRTIIGEAIARQYYAERSIHWNCHLFRLVHSNCTDPSLPKGPTP